MLRIKYSDKKYLTETPLHKFSRTYIFPNIFRK